MGEKDVWDIEVEEDHSYCAGGIIHHNSSSTPNLQNIPVRDEEIGPLIRSLFIPEDGHRWRRHDYSQIEYRLLVHYASGEGAKEAKQKYNEDPDTDYHEHTRQAIHQIVGILLERKPTKNINFGLVYGMGIPALAAGIGKTIAEAKPLFKAFHEGVPFVAHTCDKISSVAEKRGYIKTILNRRRRFHLWEPADWGFSKQIKALPSRQAMIDLVLEEREKDKSIRPGVKRAGCFKAPNALFQGGSADMMKKAMLEIWKAGLCEVIGVPLITVHDELNFSDPNTPESEEAFAEMQHIMETCVPLTVPVLAGGEVGPNWGQCEEL